MSKLHLHQPGLKAVYIRVQSTVERYLLASFLTGCDSLVISSKKYLNTLWEKKKKDAANLRINDKNCSSVHVPVKLMTFEADRKQRS